MNANEITRCQELSDLCVRVREMVGRNEFDPCCKLIYQAMQVYPSAPQPHNLLGVLLEKTGHHASAMRHFRAAWALDPSYYPTSQNLSTYGTFRSLGSAAYDESDCQNAGAGGCSVEYDTRGIGHIIRRK